MNPGTECRITEYVIGGETYTRIPFNLDDAVEPCNDCNTPLGGMHHPGCDLEECPACHSQSIGCDCPD
jgi:hypothetical protein